MKPSGPLMKPSERPISVARIERVYYVTGALFTLATSIIFDQCPEGNIRAAVRALADVLGSSLPDDYRALARALWHAAAKPRHQGRTARYEPLLARRSYGSLAATRRDAERPARRIQGSR